MKKYFLLFCLFLSICCGAYAKKSCSAVQVEPASWWIGMNNPQLQLCLHAPNIGQTTMQVDYPGISIVKQVATDNPDYLFVYLNIDPSTKPGSVKLQFVNGKNKRVAKASFLLQEREQGSAQRESFSSKDAVYLLMPDRFVNGNEKNDAVKGYIQSVDRSEPGARHGGDLEGVISKVPYIADLGCTALWITPFFENNDYRYSYHHYSTTDYYKVDPRLGKNEDYKRLGDSCRKYGLKLIIDVVPNHCSTEHYWLKSLPSKDWLHTWPTFTSSNHRITAENDVHASEYDKERLAKGWFSDNMADLNLENPELFTYLSQMYIWWMEYAGVSGIRVDTYPYNGKYTAAKFMKTFLDEYPNLSIVGECWVKSPLEAAYYQSGNNNKDGFDSNLNSVMDFVLKDHLHAAFNEKDGWDSGLSRFYNHYVQDFAFANLDLVMNFLDNHDIDRFSCAVNRDTAKYKMGLAHLITTRGYPQIYAGDEIMIEGKPGSYEGDRFDFPGGWKNDDHNAFTAEGRTAEEAAIYNYTRALLQFRKTSNALQVGKMKHFIPQDGIYVYARYTDNETVLVITNNNDTDSTISLDRYQETFGAFKHGKEVATQVNYDLTQPITIKAKTVLVLNLN